jgi:hypothetical protein
VYYDFEAKKLAIVNRNFRELDSSSKFIFRRCNSTQGVFFIFYDFNVNLFLQFRFK